MTTRPTTDKVKESLFNIIGPYFEEGNALDIFSGSGSLGIEALSRGMDKAFFIDKDMRASQVIKENIKACKFEDQSEVFKSDAGRALKVLAKRELQFDLIFMDPPYKMANMVPSLLELIEKGNLLAKDGVIICEHGTETSFADHIGQFMKYREEKYGITAVSFFKHVENREA